MTFKSGCASRTARNVRRINAWSSATNTPIIDIQFRYGTIVYRNGSIAGDYDLPSYGAATGGSPEARPPLWQEER
jgi:hypothetical protein